MTDVTNAIGIFGGSFNPVHVGHVALASEIQKRCHFQPLLIVPNRRSPLKTEVQIPPRQKLEMARIGFERVPDVEITPYELEHEGPNYAIDTIGHFKKLNPGKEIYFILGTDAFYDLPQWHEFPRLLEACSFLVVTRAGIERPDTDPKDTKLASGIAELKEEGLIKDHAAFEPFSAIYLTRAKTKIVVLKANLPEVSSTEIRLRLQMGERVDGLVPAPVVSYLKTTGLYGKRQTE